MENKTDKEKLEMIAKLCIKFSVVNREQTGDALKDAINNSFDTGIKLFAEQVLKIAED